MQKNRYLAAFVDEYEFDVVVILRYRCDFTGDPAQFLVGKPDLRPLAVDVFRHLASLEMRNELGALSCVHHQECCRMGVYPRGCQVALQGVMVLSQRSLFLFG